MVYPVGNLLLLSFQVRGGEFSLAHYARLFTAYVYFQVLLITFKIAGATALVLFLFSYPVAYLIATSNDPQRARDGCSGSCCPSGRASWCGPSPGSCCSAAMA